MLDQEEWGDILKEYRETTQLDFERQVGNVYFSQLGRIFKAFFSRIFLEDYLLFYLLFVLPLKTVYDTNKS